MIRYLAVFSFAMGLGAGLRAEDSREVKGVLELLYEPKVCVMAPCPQFRVLKINQTVPEKTLGADVVNLDIANSSARAFKTIWVEGSWTQKDEYLEVNAKEWSASVREKLPPRK